MCPPVGSAVGRSWSGEPTCRPARPHLTASHTAARPNNRPRHVCLSHATPPPPQPPSASLPLTPRPGSGSPPLGPRGAPASAMGADVTRWCWVALTHKPVADRLLLEYSSTCYSRNLRRHSSPPQLPSSSPALLEPLQPLFLFFGRHGATKTIYEDILSPIPHLNPQICLSFHLILLKPYLRSVGFKLCPWALLSADGFPILSPVLLED